MTCFFDRFYFVYLLLASPSAVIHAHSWIEKVESVYTCPPGCPKPKAFFDDFTSGVDKSKWLVAHKSWGEVENVYTNGGVVLENVEEDSVNGKVIFHAYGNQYTGDIKGINKDLTRQSTGVRTGGAIATREYFGAGSYEIRMKAATELGVCSAIWTFYYNDSGIPIVNHEIDIELPGRPGPDWVHIDFDQALLNTWVGEETSLYEAGYTQLPSRQDDGNFHVWRFDWHTEEADRRVDFYLDGQFLRSMRNNIPFYAGRLWLGAWFPSGWAGEANFSHAQMEIDWVKFTPFDEMYECPDESYPDFGWSLATNFNEAPASKKCPSGGCINSSLPMLVNKITKQCNWVARKNTTKRCNLKNVRDHCPDTCAGDCSVDSQKKFKLQNGKVVRCTWVAKKNTSKRCSKDGVSETCRNTCT